MPQAMVAGLSLDFEPDASKETTDAVHAGLIAFNRLTLGDERYRPVRLIGRDAAGAVAGGLLAELYFDWMYISVLWVREDLRGQGVGARLMALAEAYAVQEGRQYAHVDTFDFQAPAFYPRLGYELVGELGPYGDGHTRYYFKKKLGAETLAPGVP